MRVHDGMSIADFEVGSHATRRQPQALDLDSSLSGVHISDISYAEAGEWVIDQIGKLDQSDAVALRARIERSTSLLEDIKAISLWPVAAHAHMQLIHQLKHVLDEITIDENAFNHAVGDMPLTSAARWADEQVMSVDLRDPFAIADRIAKAAEKLASRESCQKWPGSAYAHRKVVADLTVFLRRTRGTVH